MNKFTIVVCGVLVAFVVAWSVNHSPDQPVIAAKAQPTNSYKARPHAVRAAREIIRPEAAEIMVSTPPTEPTTAVYVSPNLSVTHQAADFEQGEHYNIVSHDGLQLGNQTNRFAGVDSPSLVGMYISPEQQFPSAFDTVVFGFDASVPDTSSMFLEYRTRAAEGAWTDWIRVASTQVNEPMLTPVPAQRLQYRVVLSAMNVAESPQVGNVRVATRNSREVPPQTSISGSEETLSSFTAAPGS